MLMWIRHIENEVNEESITYLKIVQPFTNDEIF